MSRSTRPAARRRALVLFTATATAASGLWPGLGDAVNNNDRRFLNTFPFIADPHSGSDVECARASRPGNGNAKACGQAAAQGKKK